MSKEPKEQSRDHKIYKKYMTSYKWNVLNLYSLLCHPILQWMNDPRLI